MLVAAYFVVAPPMRYGTYGDNIACGDGKGIEYSWTLSGYFLSSGPLPSSGEARERAVSNIGTCPQDNFFAKTWALELWIAALASFGGSYYLRRRRVTAAEQEDQ